MKSFDQLFSTAGQSPLPRRAGSRGDDLPEALRPREGESRADREVRLMLVEQYRESRKRKSRPDWGVKAHHAFDLDPIRDQDKDSSPVLVYERIDPADATLYDGIPTEAVRPGVLPRGDGWREGRRPLLASVLRRQRSQQESEYFALPA